MAVPSTLLSGLIPVTCLSILPSSAQIVQNEPPKERPNILWISTEDLSPRLGCYGDPIALTPSIDRLASEGTRYTNVFTTAAISSPCRAGIITGMYQTSIGCMHMRTTTYRRSAENPMPYLGVPPHYVKAFTEYLRAAGYYCTNNSKTDYQFATRFRKAFGMSAAIPRITRTGRTKISLSSPFSITWERMRVVIGI